MDNLQIIEKRLGTSLPEVYRSFYKHCAKSIPDNLVGTDLLNSDPELNDAAIELLEEDNVKCFLEKDDVVFMMHQGYMFWYFKADSDPDPVVYGYHEGKLKPDKFERLSAFLREFLQ